jgi:hypothetical protein
MPNADASLFDDVANDHVSPPTEPQPLTEADMIARLRERYGRLYANGPHETLRYVGASHVRFGPLWPRCIADFLVQDCWGNSGYSQHPLLGFEIKVSRSDYLREIKNPGKSEPFRRVCSEWYIVASDRTIIRDDLPKGWGLLVAAGDGLRCVRKSVTNVSPEPMSRGLIAGFLRAVAMQYREAS